MIRISPAFAASGERCDGQEECDDGKDRAAERFRFHIGTSSVLLFLIITFFRSPILCCQWTEDRGDGADRFVFHGISSVVSGLVGWGW